MNRSVLANNIHHQFWRKFIICHQYTVAWVLKKELWNMEERFLSRFPGLPVIFEATTLSTLLLLVRDTTFYNVQCSETALRLIIIAQAQTISYLNSFFFIILDAKQWRAHGRSFERTFIVSILNLLLGNWRGCDLARSTLLASSLVKCFRCDNHDDWVWVHITSDAHDIL